MRQPYKTARCILYREDQFLLAIHGRVWRPHRRWGLPGGQIERGESALGAATRELAEELQVRVSGLIEIGAYSYKHALHMVYAAPWHEEISGFDTNELSDVRWFSESEVESLHATSALHAGYELEAIRRILPATTATLASAAR